MAEDPIDQPLSFFIASPPPLSPRRITFFARPSPTDPIYYTILLLPTIPLLLSWMYIVEEEDQLGFLSVPQIHRLYVWSFINVQFSESKWLVPISSFVAKKMVYK